MSEPGKSVAKTDAAFRAFLRKRKETPMKIKLETANGDFVHEQEIPPFTTPPDVIGWGDRVFKNHGTEKRPNGYTIYRECFAYALVPFPIPSAPT